MENDDRLRYKDIEATPANRLMQLSFTQLNEFVEEAKSIERNARAIIDWLTAIKAKKAELYAQSSEEGR